MVEGRVHQRVHIEALKGRDRNIVRCRRLAELVEARIDEVVRHILVVLAGSGRRPLSVSQPLGCRTHGAADCVIAPFHAGLPVMARHRCVARRGHASVGVRAGGDGRVEPRVRVIVGSRAIATSTIVVTADHARAVRVFEQRRCQTDLDGIDESGVVARIVGAREGDCMRAGGRDRKGDRRRREVRIERRHQSNLRAVHHDLDGLDLTRASRREERDPV